jgi:16S rRNA (guanine(966)-N(2))-methyltransferase RsmD
VLRYPDDPALRPSMQRTKASVFSTLAEALDGAVFVDLYAGAGAVGIEALSRGARFVHFVERDRSALEALRENLERCGIDERRYRIHADAVARVMEARPFALGDATVVFADPPYDVDLGADLLRRVPLSSLPSLSTLVVEHRTRTAVEAPDGMVIDRERRFGETTVTYFVRGVSSRA